jgi:hypothetical protein
MVWTSFVVLKRAALDIRLLGRRKTSGPVYYINDGREIVPANGVTSREGTWHQHSKLKRGWSMDAIWGIHRLLVDSWAQS